MRRLILATLLPILALPAFAAEGPKTEEQKTLYAVGLVVARQLAVFDLTPAEFELVKQGLTDGQSGKPPLVNLDSYTPQIQTLATARRDAQGAKLAAGSQAYLEKAAKEKGAIKTASGLIYQSQQEGSGASPAATDQVKVNYRGALIDGREFDSSYKRGQPTEFPLDSVIPCWTEGLQLMKPGGKARLVCPAEIAYGQKGSGMIPGNATLVFDIELLEVKQ